MARKKSDSEGKARGNATLEKKAPEQEGLDTNSDEGISEQLEAAVSESADTQSAKKAGALTGAAKAIEDGVGFVGEKAPVVASIVFHTVKKGATVAYGASSTFVREAYHGAREYAEKYKHKAEIRRLRAKRERLSARLGSIIYTEIAIEKRSPEKLLIDGEINSLIQQIERLDNEVVEIGQDLEKH